MSEPFGFVIPSIEQVQEMERKRSYAIESLEISDNTVKCQRCGNAVPLVEKQQQQTAKSKSKRVVCLTNRLKWLERHPNQANNYNNRKQTKDELAEILAADAKADKLRSLPLYSCRTTNWLFICGNCFDRLHYRRKNSLHRKTLS